VWATRDAGEVVWRKGAWNFQTLVRQAWTERRREGGNQDWSSISKRRRGGMGRGRVMVWFGRWSEERRFIECLDPWCLVHGKVAEDSWQRSAQQYSVEHLVLL